MRFNKLIIVKNIISFNEKFFHYDKCYIITLLVGRLVGRLGPIMDDRQWQAKFFIVSPLSIICTIVDNVNFV